jgi:hypothetical protein
MQHTCYELALIDVDTFKVIKRGYFSEPNPTIGKNFYTPLVRNLKWVELATSTGNTYEHAKYILKHGKVKPT